MLFRHLASLTLVAVLAASSSSVDARLVHPIVVPVAGSGRGRRLLVAPLSRDDCVAICHEVHYKTLCSTLTTLPGVTTPLQLLDVALRVAAAKSGMAEMKLDEALKTPAAKSKAMASSLQSCREAYGSLVDSLESTRKMLKNGGSHDDVMMELSAAGTFSTDCEDIFDDRPELTSPIASAQRHITRLVNNCLDLAATINLP